MTLAEDLFAALGQYAGLNALVGARIYPDVAPQGVAVPYVVWQEISDLEVNDLGGSSAESGGLDQYRVQVTCWAATGTQARAIRKQVRAAMAASALFRSIQIDARSAGFEPDTKLYGAQSDFSVWHRT